MTILPAHLPDRISHRTCRARSAAGLRPGETGFTLMEILVATVAFAILLAALNSVFFSALQLRKRARAVTDSLQEQVQGLQMLRRDLASCLFTRGLLAGEFLGVSEGTGRSYNDQLTLICTSGSGVPNAPWGDLQRVEYHLVDSLNQTNFTGKDLVRTVTRNLLATVQEQPEPEPILEAVQSFQVRYYDGEEWIDSWDSTVQPEPIPEAVRVRIEFELPPADDRNTPRRPPIEMVIPIAARPPAEAESDSESEDSANPTGGGGNGGGR